MKNSLAKELRATLVAAFVAVAVGSATGAATYAVVDDEALLDAYPSLSQKDTQELRGDFAVAAGGLIAFGVFGAYGIGGNRRRQREEPRTPLAPK